MNAAAAGTDPKKTPGEPYQVFFNQNTNPDNKLVEIRLEGFYVFSLPFGEVFKSTVAC